MEKLSAIKHCNSMGSVSHVWCEDKGPGFDPLHAWALVRLGEPGEIRQAFIFLSLNSMTELRISSAGRRANIKSITLTGCRCAGWNVSHGYLMNEFREAGQPRHYSYKQATHFLGPFGGYVRCKRPSKLQPKEATTLGSCSKCRRTIITTYPIIIQIIIKNNFTT